MPRARALALQIWSFLFIRGPVSRFFFQTPPSFNLVGFS
jgi:hypothetical protein